jgi:endonuclease/exonuclease/phosphatase (EEP) superfamily protein YafD
MNARPESEAMQRIESLWTNAIATQPLASVLDGRPRPRNDYVLFRPADSWSVLESTVIDERTASDHRPVLAVLQWRER